MSNPVETKGLEFLKKRLAEVGRIVTVSDKKTFDLIVDGIYCEVKTKHRPYSKIDFINFTDNQYSEIQKNEFIIFLVSNVGNPNAVEIKEFKSTELRKFEPKKYTSHEFNRSVLNEIKLTNL
jgi:hypothetical protein